MKTKLILGAIILILLAGLITFTILWVKRGNDILRLNTNSVKMQQEFKDKEGHWVTELIAKENTLAELEYKAQLGDSVVIILKHQLEAMGVKLRRVEHMGMIGVKVHDSLVAKVTLRLLDSLSLSYQEMYNQWTQTFSEEARFKNKYWDCTYKKDYLSEYGSLDCTYSDTCIWAGSVTKVGKWKFFNLWKPRAKAIKLDMKFLNPNARITFAEYYIIKK